MWSQYSDSDKQSSGCVDVFNSELSCRAQSQWSGVFWTAANLVGGGVWKLIVRWLCVCVCLRVHEFVLCRVELEPSPTPVCFTCISMKQEVIYPSTALSLSLSLFLSQSNRHWSLCQARWPTVLFSSSKVSSLPFICTWERPWPHTLLSCSSSLHVDLTSPVSSPVCVCVCVCMLVWVSTQRIHVCASICGHCTCGSMSPCLRVCECSFMSRPGVYCMFYQALCLSSPIGVCVMQDSFWGWNCKFSAEFRYLWQSGSPCCRSITGSSCVAEWVRVHLATGWIGLQGNEWLSLLLKDGLRGINTLCRSFASFLSAEAQRKVFQDDSSFGF